jgi:hypothetical protein
MHIPKTGGTSLRHCLYSSNQDIYPSTKMLKKNGGKYLPFAKVDELIDDHFNAQIIIGHYRLNDYMSLSNRNNQVISIFRNPIDRVVSHLMHLQSYFPAHKGKSLSQILYDEKGRVSNLQSRYLGYIPKDNNVDQVIDNLYSLSLVGITENLHDFIQQLNAKYSFGLPQITTVNKAKVSNDGSLSAEDVLFIIRRNQMDALVYHHAKLIATIK